MKLVRELRRVFLQVVSIAACKRRGRWLGVAHLLGNLVFLADGFLQKCLTALSKSSSTCSPQKEGHHCVSIHLFWQCSLLYQIPVLPCTCTDLSLSGAVPSTVMSCGSLGASALCSCSAFLARSLCLTVNPFLLHFPGG